MPSPHLIVDTREAKCIEALRRANFPFDVKPCDVGDFWIVDGNTPLCIIERKTWSDLGQSITDGRYKEQKARLHAAAAQYPQARVVYLVEGGHPVATKYQRIAPSALHATVLGLQMRDGICVLRSVDVSDTVRMLQVIVAKHGPKGWPRRNERPPSGINAPSGELAAAPPVLSKRGINASADKIYLRQLMCVPGVSQAVAVTIASKCPSPPALRKALAVRGTIATQKRKRNGRNVGPAIEEKLRQVFR